jgi:hypothetical protein
MFPNMPQSRFFWRRRSNRALGSYLLSICMWERLIGERRRLSSMRQIRFRVVDELQARGVEVPGELAGYWLPRKVMSASWAQRVGRELGWR